MNVDNDEHLDESMRKEETFMACFKISFQN
jgi:hypothetical protein